MSLWTGWWQYKCFLIGNSNIPRAARVQLFSRGILMRIFCFTSGAFNAPEPAGQDWVGLLLETLVLHSDPCPVTSRSDVALVTALALKSRPNLPKQRPQPRWETTPVLAAPLEAPCSFPCGGWAVPVSLHLPCRGVGGIVEPALAFVALAGTARRGLTSTTSYLLREAAGGRCHFQIPPFGVLNCRKIFLFTQAVDRTHRVTSLLFFQLHFFNLFFFFNTFTFIRNNWYKMQNTAIHLHGQNDSSSILDGTSFTSDTQPAVLFVSFIFF